MRAFHDSIEALNRFADAVSNIDFSGCSPKEIKLSTSDKKAITNFSKNIKKQLDELPTVRDLHSFQKRWANAGLKLKKNKTPH